MPHTGGHRQTIVRDAEPADAESVAIIGRDAVPRTYEGLIDDESVVSSIVAQSYAPSALRECIERSANRDDAHFLIAERSRRVVGFLHYDCEGTAPELHRIYVDPSRKRQGIGSGLLLELHARLPDEATYVLMVVAANSGAVQFYEHHGLVVAEHLDGVEYMHEHMGVEFPADTSPVPALVMRFTKEKGAS